MLQLRAVHRSVLDDDAFRGLLAGPALGGEALERHADAVLSRLRAETRRRAAAAGARSRIGAALDAALRTDALEHMDDEAYEERGKLAIALGLHAMNVASGSYRRFFARLAPILRDVARREGRPARLLELASGSGGFAFAAASLARRRALPVEITASDVVPLYVERGQRRAAASGLPISFRHLDALDMRDVRGGAYDVVFIAQSVHHFSGGQLARMISESRRVATTAFVAVDGFRSVSMLAFVTGTALLSMWPAMVHDAVISARKFYGEAELETIARVAAPGARVSIGRIRPLNTTLTVRFDAEAT